MRIAYFDCHSGISGDMTLGALVDLGVPLEALSVGIDSLGLPNCRLVAEEVKRKGFRATKVSVETEPEHAHRHLHHITDMIDASQLSDRQKDLAKRIFTKLGEAEAKVHGTTIRKVHFHEVGAVDSIADIVGAAIGLDLLGVDRIECSPVPTGQGEITIAHGRCSLPAPATAELLTGVPLAASDIQAELTTPTGAAILATVVDRFGSLPAMAVEKIGYGAGSRDLSEQANVLRVLVGQAVEGSATEGRRELEVETIQVLETTIDDVPGEIIGHTCNRLLTNGALDVFTTPVQMKKYRPGVTITVLCLAGELEALQEILFAETGTLGVRHWTARRSKLHREAMTVETAFGTIAGKVATRQGQPPQFTPEFESCQQAAATHKQPLRHIYSAAQQAFAQLPSK